MTGSLLFNNRFMVLTASAIIIITLLNPSITFTQELNNTLANGKTLNIYSTNASKVSQLLEFLITEEAGHIWPVVFDAEEDFSNPTGENGEGDYKKHSSGYLISGPGYTMSDEGDFRVTFYLRRGKYGECLVKDPFSGECIVVEEDRRLFTLEVWDVFIGKLVDKSVPGMTPAEVDVKWKFLETENEYYPCTVDFTTRGLPPDHPFDFRVKWWSWWNGEVDRVELNLARGILELPANPTFKDLREKADVWDDNIQKNHLINGQIVTKTINGNLEEIGDSAIWTGLYVAAEALKYGCTNDQRALTNMENGLLALHEMQSATGEPGLLCRYVYPDGQPHEKSPSKDTYTGVIFGYCVAHPFIKNQDIKRLVEEDVYNIAKYSLDHNFENVDAHEYSIVTGNIVLALHILRVAMSIVSEPLQFEVAYKELSTKIFPPGTVDLAYGYKILIETLGVREANAARNKGTHHLKWLALYNLARLEKGPNNVSETPQSRDIISSEPRLYDVYARMIEDYWVIARDEYNTLYNFFHALYPTIYGYTHSEADIRDGIWSLQLFPFDKNDPYLGRRGTGIDYGDEKYRDLVNNEFGGIFESNFDFPPGTRYPIPLDKRHRDAFIWQRGARRLTGDNPDLIYPGVDYLLVYWLGAFHGFYPFNEEIVYVDGSWKGYENGSSSFPFNTLKEGIGAISQEEKGYLYIRPGTYTGLGNIPLNISKKMIFKNWGTGSIIIK